MRNTFTSKQNCTLARITHITYVILTLKVSPKCIHFCLLPLPACHLICSPPAATFIFLESPSDAATAQLKPAKGSVLSSGSSPQSLTALSWLPCHPPSCLCHTGLSSFSPPSRLRSLLRSFLIPESPPCHSFLTSA